jgi:hypothetical protein
MGFDADSGDYAKERGMNISPFHDRSSLATFVIRTPVFFCLLPLAIASRSIPFGVLAIVMPLPFVGSRRFKFLWGQAPWFKSMIGVVLLCQIPLAVTAVFWPSLWIGFGGLLVGLLSGGYGNEQERLARAFNIPEKA